MTTAAEVASTSNKRRRRTGVTPLGELRRQHRLSLDEVAAAVGAHRGQIWRIEQGKSQPLVGLALKLARFYETTVEALFGEEDASPPTG
jgi:DNA-binding XRE family transcriptional regulator